MNRDGTCPFVSSHENILRMRAAQGNRQSERMRGTGNTPVKRLREMSRKAAAVRQATPKAPKAAKNPRNVAAGKKTAAAMPRKPDGKFRKKKK